MEAGDWFAMGIERGWLDTPVCWVHDCPKLTEEEQGYADQDNLDAVCITIARLNI